MRARTKWLPLPIRRNLWRTACAVGFPIAHRGYRRFIILGEGRSGSNFLRGLLNSHSRVLTFGELFRFQDTIGWEIPEYDRYLQTPQLIALSERGSVKFLETEVFAAYPREIAAVGFKIFYYHAQGGRESVWTYLEESRDIAVVHIKRRNTLRSFLSLKKAFETNRWTSSHGPEKDTLTITLDYQECLERFSWADAVKEEYDARFRHHPTLEVIYETLCSETESECQRVQEFLGIPVEALEPSTYKQATMPLSTAIANYHELKRRFEGTSWETFFEE